MKATIIVLLLATISCATVTSSSLIGQIIKGYMSQVSTLKSQLVLTPQFKADSIHQIVGCGFSTFSKSGQINMYNGVDDIEAFADYLQKIIKMPATYTDNLREAITALDFSDFNQVLSTGMVFNIGKGGKAKYVLMLGEANQDGTSNWIVADIQSTFTLASDIFVIEQKGRHILGCGTTKWEAKEVPKNITKDVQEVLFKFLEVTAYERMNEVFKLGSNLK